MYLDGVDDDKVIARTLYNKENKLIFDPLVYEQRYLKTTSILNHPKFRKEIKK